MKSHLAFYISLIAFIFVLEGAVFLVSVEQSYSAGFRGWALYSLFIALVHFFIAIGLILRKKWSPHLGIIFEAYIVLNFVISNFGTLFLVNSLPAALTTLSISAFLTISLFILRDKFVH